MPDFSAESSNINGQPSWYQNPDEWMMQWQNRAQLVTNGITQYSPDMVLFQEAGETIQEDVLAHLPQYDYYLGERAGDIFINTIIWKRSVFACLAKDTIWLTPTGKYGKAYDGAERGCSIVNLEHIATGKRIWVYNVHLDNKGVVARREGTKIILADIARRAGNSPVLIGGDFNTSTWAHPNSQEYYLPEPFELLEAAGFTDAWTAVHPERKNEFTFHAYKGESVREDPDPFNVLDPDRFLARGLRASNMDILKYHVDEVFPADHYPIMGWFSFTEQAA